MGRYDYKELLKKAMETKSFEDLNNLAEWFEQYGTDFWNGESYALEDGYRLFPIYAEVEDEEDEYEIVGYEIH